MSISENKKVKKIDDGIVIIVDVGREKCTVESSVYEDRKVNIHRNQYYSKDGLSRGIKNLIKKGYVNKKEAINVDKLVFDDYAYTSLSFFRI